MDIGATLRLIRLSQGRTQESVALEAGFQTSNLSRLERGEHTVTVDRLLNLSTAMNAKLSEVFRMSEEAAEYGDAKSQGAAAAFDLQAHALVRAFGGLDNHQRQVVLRMVQELSKAPRTES